MSDYDAMIERQAAANTARLLAEAILSDADYEALRVREQVLWEAHKTAEGTWIAANDVLRREERRRRARGGAS